MTLDYIMITGKYKGEKVSMYSSGEKYEGTVVDIESIDEFRDKVYIEVAF